MTTYDRLTEILDRFEVDLSDREQRLTVRVVLLFLADAESKLDLVDRVRVLTRYVDHVAAIHRAASAALLQEDE